MTHEFQKQVYGNFDILLSNDAFFDFLSDPGKTGVRSMGPDVTNSLTPTPFVDFTDVTLADEDTNSILTDNAIRAIPGNVRKS